VVVQRKIDELLALRASEWFEALPTASAAQLREFEAWLSASKLHVQEFLEIAEVEFALGGLDRQRQHDVDALLERISAKVVSLPSRPVTANPARVAARRPNWKIVTMAASWAAVALLTTLTFWNSDNPKQEYATEIGEHRVIQLADQSTVALNADSHMDVTFGKSAREIALIQGEATFQVAHDTTRPFRVHTSAGVVQAVGTKFNVRNLANGDTRVSLLEGRVRVNSSSQEVMMDAGQEVDIHVDGTIERRPNAVVNDAVAWQRHRLVFENAPLAQMVQEFNRQNRSMQLRIDGVDGSAHRYDGVFDANDPGALGQLLSREPDLEVEHEGTEIVIRPKQRQ